MLIGRSLMALASVISARSNCFRENAGDANLPRRMIRQRPAPQSGRLPRAFRRRGGDLGRERLANIRSKAAPARRNCRCCKQFRTAGGILKPPRVAIKPNRHLSLNRGKIVSTALFAERAVHRVPKPANDGMSCATPSPTCGTPRIAAAVVPADSGP
jgi:hypothetical protein